MKLYIVSPEKTGTDDVEGTYSLVTEEGELLYSHYCSNKYYAKGDLIDNRPNRIEECKQKYGEYEILFLGEDEMTNEKLLELNKKMIEKESEENK